MSAYPLRTIRESLAPHHDRAAYQSRDTQTLKAFRQRNQEELDRAIRSLDADYAAFGSDLEIEERMIAERKATYGHEPSAFDLEEIGIKAEEKRKWRALVRRKRDVYLPGNLEHLNRILAERGEEDEEYDADEVAMAYAVWNSVDEMHEEGELAQEVFQAIMAKAQEIVQEEE